MDLTSMKKSDLMKHCKEQGIKNYSKLKKDELISRLEENGIKNTFTKLPKKEKKETAKTTKPRFDKLSKKLERFSNFDDYKSELTKFNEDVKDEDLLDIVTKSMESFIISDIVEDVDYKKYVTTYGPIKLLVEYMASENSVEINSLSESELYKILGNYLYYKDTEITSTLYKKIRKTITSNNKQKKPVKRLPKYEEASEEEEDEKDISVDDNNSDKDLEESEEEESEEEDDDE